MKIIFLTNAALFGNTETEQTLSIEQIVNEATVLEKLQHKKIVRYHTTIVKPDRVYLIMDMVQGETLADVTDAVEAKGERLPEARIWHIFVQLCAALRYLHKIVKVVHRDLKPANLMLDWQDQVKVSPMTMGLRR